MIKEDLVGLDELVRLGKGTVFVPWNVGGAVQGELRIVLSINEKCLKHVSLMPKFHLVDGKLTSERRFVEINLSPKNIEYYKFVLIDDLDSLLKDVTSVSACLN